MAIAERLQQYPLLHTLVHTNPRDVPATVALRNTAAVVLPLAIGAATGHLAAGLGISAGALNTTFADQPGPYRLRVQRMLLAALAAGLAAFAGSVLGQWLPALLAALALWGFAAALLVAIGPHATRVGLISMILLVVLGAEPQPVAQAWAAAALIFAGGVLQTLFAIAAWPLQRYRPERLALAQAFRGLADFARTDSVRASPIALPPSLNDLQALMFGAGRARGRAVEAFRVLTELAERIRIELFALAHQQSQQESTGLCGTLTEVRSSAADVLTAIAVALEQAAPPHAQGAMDAYSRVAGSINSTQSSASPSPSGGRWRAAPDGGCQPDAPDFAPSPALPRWGRERRVAGEIVATRLAALGGQLRAAVRNADTAGSRGELRAQRAEFKLPATLRPANPLEILRANLRLSSPACRHAVRCGTCLAIALALSHVLPLSRGYWMPMTVAIVLRPDFGATWRVGLLRVIGTLGGLLLTTALLHFGLGGFWTSLALMTVLCFGYREFATVHYGIAVVCITGVVVILLSFYGIPPETSVHARAIDTILGSALALVAYLLWPTWERGREREILAGMLDAYREYTGAVLQGDAQTRRDTRIEARAARSRAQASLDRLRDEPASRANLPRAEALVAQANRVVRAAMMLEAARSDFATPSSPQLDTFLQACDASLREAADALREARAPHGELPLRTLQRALADSLPEPGDAFDATLHDASDRIVDAIDSVLHVLAS